MPSLWSIFLILITLLIVFSGCSSEQGYLKITFDAPGGTFSGVVTKVVTNGSKYGNLLMVEREGYSFAGRWAGAEGVGTQITRSTIVTVTGNQMKYAVDHTVRARAVGTGETNTANKVSYRDKLWTLCPQKGDYYINPTEYLADNEWTITAKISLDYSREYG